MTQLKQHCFEECTFVILGATGDLSKRKLIPAIYKLIEDNKLCNFVIVGIALSVITKQELLDNVKPFIPACKDDVFEKLAQSFCYYQMDFKDSHAYDKLEKLLRTLEQERNLAGNRIFHFATMPEHFIVITQNFVKYGIVKKKIDEKQTSPWSRVVYEKPFGYDLKSSRKINHYLAQVFDEHQVFRIDHYLGKELVANIALTRFTNRVFEPLWNNKHIDSVQIVLSEKIGIEGRGSYYDEYGAIKDMVQSHMLQLLALTAMEAPKSLSAQYLRDAKAAVLKKIKVEKVIVGQYEGYDQEKNVSLRSQTETFVALKLSINNKRWKGVPFYLKTGKRLDQKTSSVHLQFKMVECLLASCPAKPNALTIQIQPDEGIYLELNAKTVAVAHEVSPVTMEFCHSSLLGLNTPKAYEVLLSDVIKGDQSAFVRADEIDFSWKIVKQIEKLRGPLLPYKQGTKGPEGLTQFDEERRVIWHECK
jgi:glucose-6-phosphate 1-dehydrogenase